MKIEPIYEKREGWLDDTSKVKNRENLPDNAKKYISYLESNYLFQ
ncbi:MAG: adenylosuccinate synthetase [Saprospiraceae bacterium]